MTIAALVTALLAAAAPAPGPRADSSPAGPTLSATVTVSSGGRTRTYSRMLFGGFLEHFHRQIQGGIYEPGSPLADEKGFRKDVIAAVRELRTPIVRWPGGCFVSAYHWKDGVGPIRQPAFDKAWGVEDPNTFGTDEFVEWCRRAGLEPYICGNAGTGTPEEMSDWVEYTNGEKGRWARLRASNGSPRPFGVRFWSIGNENYGDWEIGAKTATEWGTFVRETSKMMRRVDPSIVLLAAALPDEGWTKNLLDVGGARLDMVSIHGYYDPLWQSDAPSDYLTCVLRSTEPEAQIAATERIIAACGAKGRISIAFDEWNLRGWHHPGVGGGFTAEQIAARDRNDRNATYTMADAVFSACFLNICLRHADTVKMANMAPLVNTRGPLYVHPGGLVRRTTFHVLWMYGNLLAERVARAEVSGAALEHAGRKVPVVDAVATCDAARKAWRIVLVNRHPLQAASCTLKFGDAAAEGRCRATVLSGDGPDAFNDVDRPDRVAPRKVELEFRAGAVEVPPHSVSVLELDSLPAAAASAPPDPVIENGGFESGEGPDRPAAWEPTRWGDGPYRAEWSDDRPRSGKRCAVLESPGGADCAWAQTVEVEPHVRYRLSAWIRTRDVVPGTGRGAFLNVQEIQGPTTRSITGTSDWVRVEMEFDSGARETMQVNCLLGGWGRSSGKCWFDDVALEPVGR